MDRLHRTRMLFGENSIQKLSNATVMIVGCGAVGSFAIEALARSGIGHLIVIDFDRIDESNINRQLFALDSTVGVSKVTVAKNRIADINPNIITDAMEIFWDNDTDLDVHPDFVIDAIDSIESKIALYKWCARYNIRCISSMGAARKTDISRIKLSRLSRTVVCPLAARVRRLVRDEHLPDIPVVFSDEVPNNNVCGRTFGSVITVTGAFGLYLANYVINELINS